MITVSQNSGWHTNTEISQIFEEKKKVGESKVTKVGFILDLSEKTSVFEY